MCQLQRNPDAEEAGEILFHTKMQLHESIGDKNRRDGELLCSYTLIPVKILCVLWGGYS